MPPLAAAHVAVLLFGFAGLFGKWLVLPASAIVLGRTVFAAAVLGAVLAHRRARPRPSWRLLANGLVLAVHWVAFFEAIQVASVAIGLLGYASFPLFVLLLERGAFGVRLGGRRVAVCTLVTAGLLALVPVHAPDESLLLGLGWGLLSGFGFALLAVANRAAAMRHGAVEVAFWQNLAAAGSLAPIALQASAVPTGEQLLLLAVLGVVCTALAHALFIHALTGMSAHAASVVAALEPVYGIVLALALLGEVPSLRTVIGGTLIVGAAMLAGREPPGERWSGAPGR